MKFSGQCMEGKLCHLCYQRSCIPIYLRYYFTGNWKKPVVNSMTDLTLNKSIAQVWTKRHVFLDDANPELVHVKSSITEICWSYRSVFSTV